MPRFGWGKIGATRDSGPWTGFFVTGTDTGVGKTRVCAALVKGLRGRGIDAGYFKPVATGGRRVGGRRVSEDALEMVRAAGLDDPLELVNPVCLREPLSPHLAARRAGRPIRKAAILAAWRALRKRHAVMIVEGVGGLLVPLGPRWDVADLAAEIGLPLLVVARTALGTINHTRLTLEAAKRRGLRVAGVVVSQVTPRATKAERAAFAAIAVLASGIPVIRMDYGARRFGFVAGPGGVRRALRDRSFGPLIQ